MGESPTFAKQLLARGGSGALIPLRHMEVMMAWTQWSADCTACAALCCIELPFDAGPDFGHDKAAGVPCRHLQGRACLLHGDLAARGYGGCARYDCLGAGQRATQTGPGTFAGFRRLHDDHLTLVAAGALPLPPEVQAARLALIAQVAAETDQTPESLEAYVTGPLPAQVRDFLRGLRSLLSHR